MDLPGPRAALHRSESRRRTADGAAHGLRRRHDRTGRRTSAARRSPAPVTTSPAVVADEAATISAVAPAAPSVRFRSRHWRPTDSPTSSVPTASSSSAAPHAAWPSPSAAARSGTSTPPLREVARTMLWALLPWVRRHRHRYAVAGDRRQSRVLHHHQARAQPPLRLPARRRWCARRTRTRGLREDACGQCR